MALPSLVARQDYDVPLPAHGQTTPPGSTPTSSASPSPSPIDVPTNASKGSIIGIVVGFCICVLILAFVAYTIWSRRRARRLGLATPSINPFADSNRISGSGSKPGVFGWVSDKFSQARRKRTAGGAYEGTSRGGVGGGGGVGLGGDGGLGRRSTRGRGQFGGLDPDEAWDARVGNEANGYGYEAQELSLRGQPARGGVDDDDFGMDTGRGGRGNKSELDARYEEEMGGRARSAARNPFADDHAEPSNMRGISPMPDDEKDRQSMDSIALERRSHFRENV